MYNNFIRVIYFALLKYKNHTQTLWNIYFLISEYRKIYGYFS